MRVELPRVRGVGRLQLGRERITRAQRVEDVETPFEHVHVDGCIQGQAVGTIDLGYARGNRSTVRLDRAEEERSRSGAAAAERDAAWVRIDLNDQSRLHLSGRRAAQEKPRQ